jgi:hypothetical protein
VPGDGRTWITIKDGPVKVTRHVRGDRKSNVGFGRLDFCSIECLVAYINDLQKTMPVATQDVEIVRRQTVLTEPVSEQSFPRLWADALSTPLKRGQTIRVHPNGGESGYLCKVTAETSTQTRIPVKLLESNGDSPAGTFLDLAPELYQIEVIE